MQFLDMNGHVNVFEMFLSHRLKLDLHKLCFCFKYTIWIYGRIKTHVVKLFAQWTWISNMNGCGGRRTSKNSDMVLSLNVIVNRNKRAAYSIYIFISF